jgi:hypothetical protein
VVIEVAPAAPSPPPSPATAARRARRARRDFSKLNGALPYGARVYVESHGERFTAIHIPQGFVNVVCGTIYRSPGAMSRAHASRITAVHPEKTDPGNGWDHIKVLDTGKTIGEVYNEHFSLTA